MRKFLIAALMSLLVITTVYAAIETYEGVDEYYVLGAVEDLNVARERAREKALRNAREQAGVYIHTLSRVVDMKLVEDEIVTIASGVIRVIDTVYEIKKLPDAEGYVIKAKVKADIDTGDVEKFLKKDAEEFSMIVANDKVIRMQETEQDNRIATLKQEYLKADTLAAKEIIAQQIVAEDKVFLSNLKLRKGNKYRDTGYHKHAEKAFTEAIELNPENFLAWHNRGWAYIEQRKYNEAMADFYRAAELKPDSELPYFGCAWIYNQSKEYAKAIEEYDKAIELNPKYAMSWNNRGTAKSWLNHWHAAISDYDKAIELKPNYIKAYENRGKAFRALGEDEKADADFQRAAKLISSYKGGDKIIEEALALNKRGEYSKALKLLNNAAKLYPDNQFIFVNRGNIYNNYFRNYEAAIADYNKTIEINDKFSWPYLNRAIAYGRLKRWNEAIVDYGRALDIDPHYASAYNGRAWTYCQIGKFEEALVDANKALELRPNEANFYDTRASAYSGLKRYAEAIVDMDRAIKLLPEGWLYYNRGEIYRLMGDETKAQADFTKAKKLGYNG